MDKRCSCKLCLITMLLVVCLLLPSCGKFDSPDAGDVGISPREAKPQDRSGEDGFDKISDDKYLIYQYAKKTGLDRNEAFKHELEKVEMDLLFNYFVSERIEKHLSVSDDEVDVYYQTNISKFRHPEQIKVKHILADTLQDAQRAHSRLGDGETFGKDPGDYRGGELDFFSRGTQDSEFERAAFGADVGSITEIVRTKKGFHIITVVARKPERVTPLDDVREEIGQIVFERKKKDALATLLRLLRAESVGSE